MNKTFSVLQLLELSASAITIAQGVNVFVPNKMGIACLR
ncbi:MAG: hypothetical protein ACI8QG_001045 [Flavobacteriales bacterium]|jgi:hypothetical protein